MKRLAAFALLLAGCTPAGDRLSVTELALPAAAGSETPRLAADPDGGLLLSWLEPLETGHRLMYARSSGDGFDSARELARGNDWFVNWADFPSVLPLGGGLWAAHWLVKRDGGPYAYDVAVTVSSDAGASWRDAVTPHRDATPTEHGFVSLFRLDDAVGLVWLDGRDGGGDHGAMSLRATRLEANGGLGADIALDTRVCDCCQTDAASIPAGPVIVYRDRSAEEIRDISLVRLIDGRWSEPVRIASDDWRIEGCPVNGPSIAARGEVLAVAWFTAAGGTARLRYVRSGDGGRHFSEPLDVADDRVFGRAAVALLDDGDAIVAWLGGGSMDEAELRVRRIGADGRLGAVRSVARPGAMRAVGFPQLAVQAAPTPRLVLVWTEPGPPSRLRAVTAALPPAG